MDWLDLLAIQETLKSLLQHHSWKASILQRSAFFTVQLSHPYMTNGKTIALTRWTLVGKVISLLLNMLSGLVITFLPRSKHLLISWLQSPSAVISSGLIKKIQPLIQRCNWKSMFKDKSIYNQNYICHGLKLALNYQDICTLKLRDQEPDFCFFVLGSILHFPGRLDSRVKTE